MVTSPSLVRDNPPNSGNHHPGTSSSQEWVSQNFRKWNLREDEEKTVIGRGVGLEEIGVLSLRALIGKFSYMAMDCHDIEDWASVVLAALIGYRLTISIFLMDGMVSFLGARSIPLSIWREPS